MSPGGDQYKTVCSCVYPFRGAGGVRVPDFLNATSERGGYVKTKGHHAGKPT